MKKKLVYKSKRKCKSIAKNGLENGKAEMPVDDNTTSDPNIIINSANEFQKRRCQTKVQLQTSLAENPWCAHGPTILFERIFSNSQKQKSIKYFACSAYRGSKECSAYFDADNGNGCNIAKDKMFKWKTNLSVDSNTIRPTIIKPFVYYCKSCSNFIETMSNKHTGHEVSKLTEMDLAQPTLKNLLSSMSTSTKEAQYHFSQDTLDVLVNQFVLKGNHDIKVICIGVPRIYETLLMESAKIRESSIRTILLDIDVRLRPFYDGSKHSSGTFCNYNMFNHFFFRESERKEYLAFLEEGNEDILVITDPPFGGKCELIGRTFSCIQEDIMQMRNMKCKVDLMWIFPYYMERQILFEIPSMKMSDFQVCYQGNGKHGYKDGLEAGSVGCRKVNIIMRMHLYLYIFPIA